VPSLTLRSHELGRRLTQKRHAEDQCSLLGTPAPESLCSQGLAPERASEEAGHKFRVTALALELAYSATVLGGTSIAQRRDMICDSTPEISPRSVLRTGRNRKRADGHAARVEEGPRPRRLTPSRRLEGSGWGWAVVYSAHDRPGAGHATRRSAQTPGTRQGSPRWVPSRGWYRPPLWTTPRPSLGGRLARASASSVRSGHRASSASPRSSRPRPRGSRVRVRVADRVVAGDAPWVGVVPPRRPPVAAGRRGRLPRLDP
jgi:hypothetical protein